MRNINDFHKIYIAFQFGPVSPSICTISACAAPTTRTAIKKLFTIISCDIINWNSIFYSWLCGLNVNGMPYKFSDWRKDYFWTILNSERTREKSSFPLWVIYMTSWFFENLEYFLSCNQLLLNTFIKIILLNHHSDALLDIEFHSITVVFRWHHKYYCRSISTQNETYQIDCMISLFQQWKCDQCSMEWNRIICFFFFLFSNRNIALYFR